MARLQTNSLIAWGGWAAGVCAAGSDGQIGRGRLSAATLCTEDSFLCGGCCVRACLWSVPSCFSAAAAHALCWGVHHVPPVYPRFPPRGPCADSFLLPHCINALRQRLRVQYTVYSIQSVAVLRSVARVVPSVERCASSRGVPMRCAQALVSVASRVAFASVPHPAAHSQ